MGSRGKGSKGKEVPELDGDAIVCVREELLAETVGTLDCPFSGQEVDDLRAAVEEGVAVAPGGGGGVGVGDEGGVSGVGGGVV